MSHLSDTDIKKIAHLARLEIVEKNINIPAISAIS